MDTERTWMLPCGEPQLLTPVNQRPLNWAFWFLPVWGKTIAIKHLNGQKAAVEVVWQCKLLCGNQPLWSHWKGCSTLSLLQYFSLSGATIMSQTRQNPLWAAHTRISGTWFPLVSPHNSKDNGSLLSCKCSSRSPPKRASVLLPRIFRSQLRGYRNTSSSFTFLLPRNRDLIGLQIITHPATTSNHKVLCYNNFYTLIKGENSSSRGIRAWQ